MPGSETRNQQSREAEAALRATSLFAPVEPATLAELAALATSRRWAGGELIFQRGDAGDFLLVLTEGQVRLALATAEGRELVLGHLGPGDVLGEFSLIDRKPRSADASAVAATAALVLHRDAFLRVAGSRPDLGLALARHLCAQLRSTNYQMESIALHELRARVIRFFLLTLPRDGPLPEEAELRLDISQGELAAVLGASRPKVNQVLQMLLAEGVLRRDGSRTFCRPAELHEMLGEDPALTLL